MPLNVIQHAKPPLFTSSILRAKSLSVVTIGVQLTNNTRTGITSCQVYPLFHPIVVTIESISVRQPQENSLNSICTSLWIVPVELKPVFGEPYPYDPEEEE